LGWKGLKASEYVDKSDYGFLSTPNIKNNDIAFEKAYFITQKRYNESPEIMLEKGDVVLAKDGSTLGTVNIIKSLPFKCTVNSSLAVLRSFNKDRLNSSYLMFFLKSEKCQNNIDMKKDGMGVPHLFQSDINNFVIPIPPFLEQTTIIAHIKKETTKIDNAITLQQKQIEKLKEYKATLINSAVTGKIKVVQ
jgi:type I restriction enzyme S subunit